MFHQHKLKLKLVILLLSFSFSSFGQNHSISDLIQCHLVNNIEFNNVPTIIAKENLSLYESSLDTLKSLYCYSKTIKNPKLEAISLVKLGQYYLFDEKSEEAYQIGISCLIHSIDLCKTNDFKNSLLSANEILCDAFTANQMYDQSLLTAQEFLTTAHELNDSVRIAEGNMMLGRIFREQRKYELSDSILNTALQYLTNSDYSKKVGSYIFLHLSNLKRLEGKYHHSIEIGKKGLAYLEEYHNIDKSRIEAFLALEIIQSEIELKIFENEHWFDMVREGSSEYSWVSGQYHLIKGMKYEKMGKPDLAINSYLESLAISEKKWSPTHTFTTAERLLPLLKTRNELSDNSYKAFLNIKGSVNKLLAQNQQNNLFKSVHLAYENEKIKSELLLTSLRNYRTLSVLTLGGTILLLLVVLLIFRQYRLKKHHNNELNILNDELQKNNIDLTQSKEEIESRKNALQSELKEELINSSSHRSQLDKIKGILQNKKDIEHKFKSEMLSVINNEHALSTIKEINVKFLEINNDFVSKLCTLYPRLTSNDVKICLYLKMNLSSKEIAQIQYKSVAAIKVARSRIRKKIGLNDKETTLYAFLSSLEKNRA